MAVYPAQWTIEGGKCPLQRTLLCTILFLPFALEHRVTRKIIQQFNCIPYIIVISWHILLWSKLPTNRYICCCPR